MPLPFTAAEPSHEADHESADSYKNPSVSTFSKEAAARIFNTAIVTSRPQGQKDFSAEISKILESPAFHCILRAAQDFATEQGISPLAGAEELIRSFRRIDQFWTEYLLKEGIDPLRQDA